MYFYVWIFMVVPKIDFKIIFSCTFCGAYMFIYEQ